MSEYRTITTTVDVASSTQNALAVYPKVRKTPTHVVWIPKSLIHGGDLLKIEKKLQGTTGNFEETFRVAEWKAEALGWA